MRKKKIGILTWHYYGNFGSQLQAYALQEVLEKKCNACVQIINYRNSKFNHLPLQKEKTISFLGMTFGRLYSRFYKPAICFRSKYLNQTKMLLEKEQVSRICDRLDYIVFGSDQIWAPNALNTIYMGDFSIDVDVKKVAYAPSIGLQSIPDEMKQQYRDLLSDFKALSIREKTGADLLENEFGLKAQVVLDPTLLLEAAQYRKMQKTCKICGNYCFCYFLNSKNEYKDLVRTYASEHGMKVVGISSDSKNYEWMQELKGIGPREFLWLIDNASVIFTDSYHGTIFSLLFHKNFYTLKRFSENSSINQNSRIYQLDKYFFLRDRIIENIDSFHEVDEYDFGMFERVLAEKRKEAIGYLKGVLQ